MRLPGGCAISLQPQFSPDVQSNIILQNLQFIFYETEVALFKYRRLDDLASNNIAPNVNRKSGSENVSMYALLIESINSKQFLQQP
jgi:hypothetical protein